MRECPDDDADRSGHQKWIPGAVSRAEATQTSAQVHARGASVIEPFIAEQHSEERRTDQMRQQDSVGNQLHLRPTSGQQLQVAALTSGGSRYPWLIGQKDYFLL